MLKMLKSFASVLELLLTFVLISQCIEADECGEDFDHLKELKIKRRDFSENTENYYLSQAVCDYRHIKSKNNVNSLQTRMIYSPQKALNSIRVRCAACLAIAQEINQTIKRIPLGFKDPAQEVNDIKDTIIALCANGFNTFDLSSYNGGCFLTKPTRLTNYVSSKVKLGEICSFYLDHINLLTFYTNLLKRNFNIADYLCRSDGVFRDCYNV